jgi:hypothetical protein
MPKIQQEQIKEANLQPTPPTMPTLEDKTEPAPSDQAASEPVLPKKQPTPLPKAKPQPPQDQPKKKSSDDSLNALLNNLTSPSTAPKNARVASRTQRGFGDQSAMTMDLEDALRNQIEQCMDWGPLAGAPNLQSLVVSVQLTLNADGNIASISPDPTHGPYEAAAMSAALRAIHVCSPYKLPPNRYSDWRESDVRFSPKDVSGQ